MLLHIHPFLGKDNYASNNTMAAARQQAMLTPEKNNDRCFKKVCIRRYKMKKLLSCLEI
jgi:hypothetical protein